MQIRAAVTHPGTEPGTTLEDVELAEPHAEEILVRLVATGVCHTDLTFQARWSDFQPELSGVLGHEGAGIVQRVGADVKKIRDGDHVLLSYDSCRGCSPCRAGHPYYCDRFFKLNVGGRRGDGTTAMSLDGNEIAGNFFGQSSFATYALATERNAVVVDPSVDLTAAAPLGCGIQTGAGMVLNQLQPRPGSSIVIFGAGGVGLAAAMAAAYLGVETIVVSDPVESRRPIAMRVGATHVLDPTSEDPVAAIRDLTGGGASTAVDSTANADVILQGLDCLGVLGSLVTVGGQMDLTVDLPARLANGKSIRTTIEGEADPHEFIPRLLDLQKDGYFPLGELIETYPFEDFDRATKDSADGTTIKPVLIFD
jgi:aryl-alcohol dehydrogenase